jgi:glycogen synthase
MTVSPMYSNYSDVRDTGVRAPVQMPLDTAAAAAAAEQQKQLKQQQAEQRQQQHQQQQLQEGLLDAAGWRRASRVYSSMDEGVDHDQAAPSDVARAAAVYSSMDELAEDATADLAAPAGAAGDSSSMDGNYVHYYMCTSSGVDRVFVDHPLYHGGADRGSGTPWTSAVVSTYCHPDSSAAAAVGGATPDLAAAASLLCQAALAAPLLLWGVGGGLAGQQQQQQHQRQERKWQQQQRQQQLEMLLLLKLLGLEQSQAAAEAAAAVAAAGGGVAGLLSAAAQAQQAALVQGLRYPQQIVAGRARPVLLGTGGSEVDRRWPVCDLLLPRQGEHGSGSSSPGVAAAGPVLFIGNDWPCGVLPLWLDMYRQEAQQQWQHHNPHLDWLLRQQQDLFSLQKQHLQHLQQLQRQQQAGGSSAHGSVEGLVQAALQACSNSSSSGTLAGPNLPGSNAAADVFGEYSAVYVNGSNLADTAVQPQQLLQELQEGWQREAAASQPAELQSGGVPLQQGQAQQAPAAAGWQPPAEGPGDSSSWSAAAESWLQAVGYQPGSVYNAELSALVEDAVAAGRVARTALPALSAAQSQLQQLLQQEQELGDAIEELLAAARQQQPQPATVVSMGYSSSDLRPAAAAAAAASGGSRTLAQVGSGPGRPASPLQLSHKQELALLQQLVGRQLSGSKVALAVHNFGYQGGFTGQRHFDRLGLPQRLLPSFAAPVALAAKAAVQLGSKVSSKMVQAAASAASAVGSQLAALGEALQRLGRPKAAAAGGSGSGSSSSYGLLASMQEMLVQASVQAAEQQAGLQQQAGQEQREQQQQQQQGEAVDWDADKKTDGDVLPGSSPPQLQQRYYHHTSHQQQLPAEVLQPGARPASPDSLQLNWLAAGLAKSDAVITVSPNYAQEMLLEPAQPARRSSSSSGSGSRPGSPSGSSPGMAALLASKQLRGIMNGLDTAFWDPAADPLLPAAVRYSAASVGPGKAAAKVLLQRRLGLAVDPAVPLFAFVGRLTYQKGVDVILATLPQLMGAQRQQASTTAIRQVSAGSSSDSSNISSSPRPGAGLQLVLLGSGEAWMEAVLGQLGSRYPGAAVGVPDFNEPLAHLLLAGADFLLVPSRYEPCGLVALAALRYGAVPLATATGGLADIVTPEVGYSLLPPGPEGDTAGFRRGVADLAATVKRAAAEYGGPVHEARRAAAMAVDVSWEAPCTAWEQLLLQLAGQQGGEAAVSAAGAEDEGDDGDGGGVGPAEGHAAVAAVVPAAEGVAAIARH